MHTDESWLAGLSRAMISEHNPAATEPFFNLINRAPHAIKILFHSLQIIFIKVWGFSLFSVRFFSLLTGAGCLFIFSGLLKRLGLKQLPGVIMLSLQIQFIYASHLARQEIQILFLMLLSLYLLYGEANGFRRGMLAGLPIAIAVGFHPNAFIAAWPAGLILLSDSLTKRRSIREGFGFLIPPALSAALFILLSFSFNSSFAGDYGGFGEEVGVLNSFDIKLLGFDDFYRKLFLRVSGTYYTPRILPVFILAAACLLIITAALLNSLLKRDSYRSSAELLPSLQLSITGIIGVNIGIILIGKYSAPSVVFQIPFLITIISAASGANRRRPLRIILFAVPASIILLNSVSMIYSEAGRDENYSDYIHEIQCAIPALSEGEHPEQHRVLGPLTAEFALEYGRLLDWRNLAELNNAGTDLARYIESSGIEYIIYTEELEIIYQNRPVWNILYGNPSVFYIQLSDYLKQHCEPVYSFSSPGYGTRIVMHRFIRDWRVDIYRVAE